LGQFLARTADGRRVSRFVRVRDDATIAWQNDGPPGYAANGSGETPDSWDPMVSTLGDGMAALYLHFLSAVSVERYLYVVEADGPGPFGREGIRVLSDTTWFERTAFAAADGRAFVTGVVGNELWLYALDATTGDAIWPEPVVVSERVGDRDYFYRLLPDGA